MYAFIEAFIASANGTPPIAAFRVIPAGMEASASPAAPTPT